MNDPLSHFDDTSDTAKPQFQSGNKYNIYEDPNVEPIAPNSKDFTNLTFNFAVVTNGEVPEDIAEDIVKIGEVLYSKGFKFRFNGDSRSSTGISLVAKNPGKVDVFLPFKKFNTDLNATITKPSPTAYGHAAYYHKGFKKLPNFVRAMISIDTHLVLGAESKAPIKFLICYSDDGAETKKDIDYKKTGFASFLIGMCCDLDIPVFNLGKSGSKERLSSYVKTLTE